MRSSASRRVQPTPGSTIASDAGRPPSEGTAAMSHSTSTPSRRPRMNEAKPPSRAWIVSHRAGRSPAVRRVCYPRRGCDEAAGGDGGRCCLASDLEGQLTFENIERIGMAVVNVRAGYPFARRVAGACDCHLVARDENADLAIPLMQDRLPVADDGDVAFVLCEAAAAASGGLVAIEVFPADGLPGRAVRAAFPRPLDRRRERVAAADRLPGAPAGRPELDT